jgi:hypothetical protein
LAWRITVIVLGVAAAVSTSTAATTTVTTASASTSIAATTTAPAVSATATTAAFALRTRFVHVDPAPRHFLAVQRRHCVCGFVIVGHFDERESARASGFSIHGDVNARYLSESTEEFSQLGFGGLEVQITHEQVLHLVLLGLVRLARRSAARGTRRLG